MSTDIFELICSLSDRDPPLRKLHLSHSGVNALMLKKLLTKTKVSKIKISGKEQTWHSKFSGTHIPNSDNLKKQYVGRLYLSEK